jgi:WG containing repeat
MRQFQNHAAVCIFMLSCNVNSLLLAEEPAATAAKQAPKPTPHPFCDGKLWGYIDNEGKVLIKPQFRTAGDFFEERAIVNGDGFGYIKPDGSWAAKLPEGTTAAQRFSGGGGWFKQDGKYGCVDESGKVIITPQYDDVNQVSEGVVRAMTRVTEEGKENEVWKSVGLTGKVVAKKQRTESARGTPIPKIFSKDRKYGLKDERGVTVVEPKWNDFEDFHDGLARVHRGGILYESRFHEPQVWEGGAWYYVDHQGKEVALCKRDGEKSAYYGREHGVIPHYGED